MKLSRLWLIVCGHVLSSSLIAGPESVCSFNKGNCPHLKESGQHGFVQDYGYGGFTSTVLTTTSNVLNPGKVLTDTIFRGGTENPECVPNPSTPIVTGAAVLYNGKAKAPSREELRSLHEAGKKIGGYSFSGPNVDQFIKTTTALDESLEELVFLTATDDISRFNECQNGLFRNYYTNKDVKSSLHENAWKQYSDIVSDGSIIEKFQQERLKRNDVIRADSITYCVRENCPTPTENDFERLRNRDSNEQSAKELRSEINLILSRIPLGNRDLMRIELENLLLRGSKVSQQEFDLIYSNGIKKLDTALQESRDFIRKIRVETNGLQYYCVDRNIKENLYRSGQVDHTVHRLGLDSSLANFKLRSQNRYGLAGTVITEVALIPSYFVGYGAARLALRAGAGTVKAVTMGGRVLAGSTRFAMLALEAADYGSAISNALKDCDSSNFRARVDGQQCNPNDEIGMAYEEASLAQCLTSSLLPFASAFVGTGVRVVDSQRLKKLYQASSEIAEAPVEEIVVTAKRVRPEFKFSSEINKKKLSSIFAKYPKVISKRNLIGNNRKIITAKRINSPAEIPFSFTDTFRPVDAEEMVRRAQKLDPEISRMITRVYNTINDKNRVKKYFKELYVDASLWMLYRGRAEDLAKLSEGLVTEQAIAIVLIRRAKARGDTNFTTLKQILNNDGSTPTIATGKIPIEEEVLANPNKAFRFSVKTGPFIDRNFPQSNLTSNWGHGPFAHMIQREMILDEVNSLTNGNPQKFWDFMGSPKGINFWADVFDSGNPNSMSRPETLTAFMLQELCGIGI